MCALLHVLHSALCVVQCAPHLPPHAHLPDTNVFFEQLHGLSSKSKDTMSLHDLWDRCALNLSAR